MKKDTFTRHAVQRTIPRVSSLLENKSMGAQVLQNIASSEMRTIEDLLAIRSENFLPEEQTVLEAGYAACKSLYSACLRAKKKAKQTTDGFAAYAKAITLDLAPSASKKSQAARYEAVKQFEAA